MAPKDFHPGGQMRFTLPESSRVINGIIAACGVLFLWSTVDPATPAKYLALWPDRFWPWQLFTAMFLHGGLFHFLVNMVALWMLGSEVEKEMGRRTFLVYLLLCGVGANTVWWIVNHLRASRAIALGFSGAIFALLAAYYFLFPERTLYAYGLFPMRARTFVIFLGLFELAACFALPGDTIAHLIHLAGGVLGAAYFKWQDRSSSPFLRGASDGMRQASLRWRARHLTVIKGGKGGREDDDEVDDAIIEP